jgi:hypothetical protein
MSGLGLEVKGDFCHQLRGLMRQHGRADDYIEVSLDAPYRYNPLHNENILISGGTGKTTVLNALADLLRAGDRLRSRLWKLPHLRKPAAPGPAPARCLRNARRDRHFAQLPRGHHYVR